ncbi:MAG TPA: class I SAM-dependent methyltransferase [Acidimicrobiia bacterium]|nr:class I SAM-dependent methyltransferase [Acidimicrobiia bacterium]
MSWHDSRARRLAYRALIKTRVEAERRLGRGRLHPVKRALGRAGRRNLAWLAAVHGSDKGAISHNYVEAYRTHLAPLRRRRVSVLEIGIWQGASLAMWRDYFPRGDIVGIDIEEKDVPGPRITTLVGDQGDVEFLASLERFAPFDLVVDDGSHRAEHIVASFGALFPMLRNGGVYVIEDLQTSYHPGYGGGPPGTPGTGIDLVKQLVDAVHRAHVRDGDDLDVPAAARSAVRAVHVYEKIAFIEKA